MLGFSAFLACPFMVQTNHKLPKVFGVSLSTYIKFNKKTDYHSNLQEGEGGGREELDSA